MLWVFGLSLSIIILLLGLKTFELWLQRVTVISKIISRMDPVLERGFVFSFRIIDRPRQNLKNLSLSPYFSPKKNIEVLNERLKKGYNVVSEKSRGKLSLTKRRKESNFWNSISDHKNSLAYKKAEIDKWGNE